MKHINIDELYPLLPRNWETRAATATERARNKPGQSARTAYIKSRYKLWRELVRPLMQLSNRKCWYCGRKIEISDDVDHFRPKGKVDECLLLDGYWWLAFDWHNYRMSCKYCNSGGKDEESDEKRGKSNHFPLMNENIDCKSCAVETCPRGRPERPDHSQEFPALLDPIDQKDPSLITYNPDGSIGCGSTNAMDIKRVEISRFIYNLDVSNQKRQGIRDLMYRIASLGSIYFSNYSGNDLELTPGQQETIDTLRLFISDNAEFDMAAKQYFDELKTHYPWLSILN